ncbi:MAG: MFS transporter, partial [Acidimicrobiales bacterium]|nr:MFS transporter [Acidimicrobiales bacterium]
MAERSGMTVTAGTIDGGSGSTNTDTASKKVGFRTLNHYPNFGVRTGMLLLVVVSSIVLWYQYYVPTSVAPLLLPHFHMSFTYYVTLIVISNIAGVIAALAGGLADKIGRANIVVGGLLVVAVVQTFVLPNASSKLMLGVGLALVGLFEGVVLVATPALVRDFTPQLGRASAMGFWTLGPVAGVLTASLVGTHTISATSTDWQREFLISGIAGFVVFVLSAVLLKELSPRLRDQLMVSSKDRELVELKARGLDVERATQNPWKQMFKFEILASAFAISVMLIIFYTASGFFPVYISTSFHQGLTNVQPFTLSQANGIDTWIWAADCLALVIFGILSDLAKVRKPFMLVGALGALSMMVVSIGITGKESTGYYEIIGVNVALFAFLGMAYSTWMASFTETVEARNPALVATGLAIWGAILRAVVALSLLALPHVVTSAGPIVDNQSYLQYAPKVLAIEAKDHSLLVIVEKNQALFTQLATYKNPLSIPPTLLGEAVKAAGSLNTLIKINEIKPD